MASPTIGRLSRVCAAGAAVACAVAIAACGSTSDGTTTSGSAAPDPARYAQFLGFSKCMRSHGLPSFPDPNAGGGIALPAGSGLNPSSPAFKAAQATCSKLLPGGGPGNQHPTAEQIGLARRVSECMRKHGVSDFPDPALKQPSSPAGYSILEDRGGVILAVPSTISPQSPVFVQASKACHFS